MRARVSNISRIDTFDGVRCVVIQDRLYLIGYLGERTTEWYSQDKQGNVWYFGENTAELAKNGHVTSTSGTWRAGLDGAKPSIYMPAHPSAMPVSRSSTRAKLKTSSPSSAFTHESWFPTPLRVVLS